MSIQNAYDEWSGSYDSDGNLTRDLDEQVTRQALAGLHFASILELGCGTGKNTVFLAEIGGAVLAVDFSAGMIEKARQKVRTDNVRFSMMDLTQKWNVEAGAVDLIVCNLVLEHVQNLEWVFSEAARTLKPGGRFFISELHPFKQYEGKKARIQREGGVIEIAAFVHHISEYLNAAKRHGLSLVALSEHWHEQDQNKPPRLISLLLESRGADPRSTHIPGHPVL